MTSGNLSRRTLRGRITPRRYARNRESKLLNDKFDVVFCINSTTVDVESSVRLEDTLNELLQFDDDRVAAEAESFKFLEFELFEITNRNCYQLRLP